jgi:hypothetical protein
MIGRIALRSLTAHPVRSAVLAAGFGVGVGVMAILLGVAEVILDQARSPALAGGGDVVIRMSPQVPARLLLSGALQSDALRERVQVASPLERTSLFLLHKGRSVEVLARGGIPSLERALGDEETALVSAWSDSEADVAWTRDTPGKVLRQIDRFHPIPDLPEWAGSWAEWLYFNGRAQQARFYLTFLVGPRLDDGRRSAGVRLQLDRSGKVETFSQSAPITDAEAERAPDLTIGTNSVRLNELRYSIRLDLTGQNGRRITGELTIDASPGRLLPPLEIAGARGWRSGYVVPVMSGRLRGTLHFGPERLSFDEGSGYHDHNWGFWQGVSWQWGQVQHDGLSLIYGRVFPPPEAADPERIPGFVGALGPDGPLGYATNVNIEETDDDQGRPRIISIRGRSQAIDVRLRFDVGSTVLTRMNQGTFASDVDFLQMQGQYTVTGSAGDRTLSFSAPGSAETFRGRER